MQQAVVINTLSFAKKLRVAGFNDEQAEIQAEAINDVLIDFQDKRLEELATKGDLKAVSADLRAEINKTESRLIKWGVGLFVVQFAALAALLKLF